MSKKLIYLVCFVLVLSVADNASADLILHWTFDEGSGTTVNDSSGNGHVGTIEGATWTVGDKGPCLEFGGDGDRVVDENGASYLNGLDALTVCMWIKSDLTNTDKGFLEGEDPDDNDNVFTMRYDSSGLYFGGSSLAKMAVTSTPGGEQQLESSSNIQVTEWQHVAMTWSSGDLIRFYINGVEDTPSGRNGQNNAGPQSGVVKLIIGQGAKDSGGGWDGLIDDVRIYDHSLSEVELLGAMEGKVWPYAIGPTPADGALHEDTWVSLGWTPGGFAVSHDVYFGDNFDDVNDGTGSTFQGNQTGTVFNVGLPGGPYPDGLVLDTTYYWRIDEFDGVVIHKGDIWNFRTLPEIDLNLIAWYRFDGNALDSSGNDLHGTEMGNPTYEAGVFGQAISLDGDGDYVDCGLAPEFDITDEITFTYWIKVFAFDKGWDTVLSKGDDSWRSSRAGFNNFMEAAVNGTTGGYTLGVTPVDDDQWHHVGFVYDGTMNYLYVDGEVDASEPSTGQIDVSSYPLCIGANSQHLGEGWSSCWNGLIDDVQIYNRALSQEEVQIIMQSSAGAYSQASSPVPADGALNPNTWVSLSWSPGYTAVSHDVYFGENFDDVEAGTKDTFQGNQTATYFAVGSARFPYLVPGVTYYWRVDEVEVRARGTTTHKGVVWSFLAPPKTAFNPEPADGAKYVYPNVELSWSSGSGAQLHIVYFGDNFDDVNIDAGGFLEETTTYTPGPLEWDKVYYWRIDEFDGVVINKGEVWSFRTLPEIDPNLIGWWKFDEGSGTIAYDSSGNGNDGTFNGDPQWVPNQLGCALDFDGSGDWLDCGEDPSLQITDAVTVAAWIKLSATGIDQKVGSNQSGIAGGYKMTVYFDNKVEFEIRTSGNTAILNRDVGGGTVLQKDVWYHVAGVYSQKGNYIRTYVDGNFDRELITSARQALGASLGPFMIGCEPFETSFQDHHFNGVMDDVRIYNRTLTEDEIQFVMEGKERPFAFNPEPADGALNPNTWVSLSWSPGGTAVSHDVYFGNNFDDVEAGTGGTFQGNQTATYFAVGSYRSPYLVPGMTYYWRVDEVEADGTTIHKGDVWSFTVAGHLSEALDASLNFVVDGKAKFSERGSFYR